MNERVLVQVTGEPNTFFMYDNPGETEMLEARASEYQAATGSGFAAIIETSELEFQLNDRQFQMKDQTYGLNVEIFTSRYQLLLVTHIPGQANGSKILMTCPPETTLKKAAQYLIHYYKEAKKDE